MNSIDLLLIEDDPNTAQTLMQGLEEEGMAVRLAADGAQALELAAQTAFDVIVSDVLLPSINGLDFCRQLREQGIQTGVLFISALDSTEDRLNGFEHGGDDYLVKPFAFKELVARIHALHKRSNRKEGIEKILKVEDLEVNLETRSVKRANTPIELTAREFSLLVYFMKNKGRVLSKAEISEHVWHINFDTGTNVVEVYVTYLRRKIDKQFNPKLIHTHFGVGYVLKHVKDAD